MGTFTMSGDSPHSLPNVRPLPVEEKPEEPKRQELYEDYSFLIGKRYFDSQDSGPQIMFVVGVHAERPHEVVVSPEGSDRTWVRSGCLILPAVLAFNFYNAADTLLENIYYDGTNEDIEGENREDVQKLADAFNAFDKFRQGKEVWPEFEILKVAVEAPHEQYLVYYRDLYASINQRGYKTGAGDRCDVPRYGCTFILRPKSAPICSGEWLDYDTAVEWCKNTLHDYAEALVDGRV